jgi:prepilin peptidase CpaA
MLPASATMPAPLDLAAGVVLVALLAAACFTDLRERRIPNRLVVAILASGVVFALARNVGVAGLGRALAAGALGFAIWIPFYAFRMLGAGDVKMFAAAAVWLAPMQVVHASLYTAAAGGVLSVFWLVLEYGPMYGLTRAITTYQAPLSAFGQSHVRGAPRRHVPYGIAMAVGLALAFWLPRFR